MTSVVDICNSALNQMGASNIISLTEDSKNARILNQRYEYVRDSVFRAHPWNCLVTRVKLSPDTAAPAFGFTKQFTLPTDPYCLRVLTLNDSDLIFRVEGRKILCDEDSISLKYVGRVVDANQYDLNLVETLAAALAADISYAVVGSTSLAANMISLYDKKLSEARFIDATEGTPGAISNVADSGTIESNTFIKARF